MMNYDDFIEFLRNLVKRRINQAGHDWHSELFGEISTDELKYRRDELRKFINTNKLNQEDGTQKEAEDLLDKFNDVISKR